MSQQQILTTIEYHAYNQRIANAKSLLKYACPCNYCCGGNMRKIQLNYEHMLKFGHNGVIPFLQNYYPDSIPLQSMRDVETQNIDEEETNLDEEEKILDEGLEIDRMMNDGFNND